LIRNNHPWYIGQALEQFAEKLLRGLLIASALYQDIEDVVVLIDGSPQVMALTVDGQENLIQVPLVPCPGASTLHLICIVLPKLQTTLADGFMSDVDSGFTEELLHVAVAQGEAIIEPDAMADDLTGKAVIFVALGVSRWRHVWLPIGVCEWFLQVHHWSEYLTGQAVGSTT